ncbi:hypothetical protein Plec18170_009811 [Paecilomyces lecythidis]
MESPEKDWIALEPGQVGDGLGLRSSRMSERLNQIDRVRANGVGDHIALPQLVVCGDQSAGKSSVLEGITGIPFPRQDGLCTRFATEIILRHNPHEHRTTATIIPHASRPEEEKSRLTGFRHELRDFAELPGIIEEAATLMGIRDSGAFADAPTFSADVLRLELVGDTGVHLTIVDLPGLISVSENKEDVELVDNLVCSYLENSRTIILAVVPASSDIDTQGIIQRARSYDKDGLRTVGIITKPDLINTGTESRVARLAKNLDRTKLNLGFFLLKNPTPAQLEEGISHSERRKIEQDFFLSGPWREQGLDPSRIGIENLRSFLQDLLDRHIERELPKVRRDVRRLLNQVNEELVDLGPERSTAGQIRLYLTRISTEFHNLVKAGVEGLYGGRDGVFFQRNDDKSSIRLRATIHRENEKFAEYMRRHGEKRKILSDSELDEAEAEDDQVLVTGEEMTSWVRQIYEQTRGQELPGNYNHALLSELFHEQSSRWGGIARQHVDVIAKLVSEFIDNVLTFVVKDAKVRHSLRNSITATLDRNIQQALEELEKLLQDESGHPITYNHYYTDNIQKARSDRLKRHLEDSTHSAIQDDWHGRFHFSNTSEDITRLLASLQERVIVNMTEQACSEARADLNAYYKVAMKTFIDNICRQVIERHVLSKLTDVFSPVAVSAYEDSDLLDLAAETAQTRRRRTEACQLQEALEQSLRDLGN